MRVASSENLFYSILFYSPSCDSFSIVELAITSSSELGPLLRAALLSRAQLPQRLLAALGPDGWGGGGAVIT